MRKNKLYKKLYLSIFEKIKKNYLIFFLVFLLLVLYIYLYKIYMPRINAFGCFDDCGNFLGGYFFLHGKRLYSEIFFNHNPLMVYISWIIQLITSPDNLYELILRHRQSLLLFSFLFNLGLFIRFGITAIAFALFFELTKFYLFGDRFLAESFIVYPLAYLAGLFSLKFYKKALYLFDYVLAGIFVWFIIFMREPYVPAAILLFIYLLWNKKKKANSIIALGIFLTLSFFTLALHDINEYFFNVVTTNFEVTFASEAQSIDFRGLGILKIFFYPITVLFLGEWGYFRFILVSLNSLFLVSVIFLLLKKQWKFVFLLVILLGVLNIRYVEPGLTYYGAFHLLCWYGVFIFMSFMILAQIIVMNKRFFYFITFLYSCLLIFHISSPLSFLNSKPNPHDELITNYGIQLQVGNVINILSNPDDKLFLDGFDDIIYWQAKRFSDYKYSMYTAHMPYYEKYASERIRMFKENPPNFYYGSCPKEKNPQRILPKSFRNDYIRLYDNGKPSCLWVRKTKLKSISETQWRKARENYYTLEKE